MEVFLHGVLRTVDEEGGRGDSGGEVLGVEGKDGTLNNGAVVTCMYVCQNGTGKEFKEKGEGREGKCLTSPSSPRGCVLAILLLIL